MINFSFFRKAVSGVALIYALVLTGCDLSEDIFDGKPGPGALSGSSRNNSIRLVVSAWANGAITSTTAEQWFQFTATDSTQYVHVRFGTLNNLYVRLYDSNGGTLGSQTNLHSNTNHTSFTVTSGQTYYIKVTPYSSSGTGTYRIAFNTSSTPPA
jgi:hypothetical protein